MPAADSIKLKRNTNHRVTDVPCDISRLLPPRVSHQQSEEDSPVAVAERSGTHRKAAGQRLGSVWN